MIICFHHGNHLLVSYVMKYKKKTTQNRNNNMTNAYAKTINKNPHPQKFNIRYGSDRLVCIGPARTASNNAVKKIEICK